MSQSIELIRIGTIRSPYKRSSEIHPLRSRFTKGTVEVFSGYERGLKDIEEFSHIYLVWWAHLSKGFNLLASPIMHPEPLRGMFSTRIPARPNPICLTVVRLIRRKGRMLEIKGVDTVDGTPLLDIKPYVSGDSKSRLSIGWLDDVERANR